MYLVLQVCLCISLCMFIYRSIGVLVYVLLTGFTPFGGDTDAETFRNIGLAQVDFPDELFEDISDAAKDWISRCLALRPE